jgi:hypothetical protein
VTIDEQGPSIRERIINAVRRLYLNRSPHMAEPKTWHWDWKEKADAKNTGTYESSGIALQTEQDVKDFVEIYYPKLDVVRRAPRREGDAIRGAVNPEHYMSGTMAELREKVRRARGEAPVPGGPPLAAE